MRDKNQIGFWRTFLPSRETDPDEYVFRGKIFLMFGMAFALLSVPLGIFFGFIFDKTDNYSLKINRESAAAERLIGDYEEQEITPAVKENLEIALQEAGAEGDVEFNPIRRSVSTYVYVVLIFASCACSITGILLFRKSIGQSLKRLEDRLTSLLEEDEPGDLLIEDIIPEEEYRNN